MAKNFLNRSEAASYVREQGLPCARLTLQKFACTSGGPEFQRFGARVVYTVDGLDRWIGERLGKPIRSTHENA
jgi:hypothetical protein